MDTTTTRTSIEWWAATKADPERLMAWLFDQYRGEVTAADRILRLRDANRPPKGAPHPVLTTIPGREGRQPRWVAGRWRIRRTTV